jgi:hypothetical protein
MLHDFMIMQSIHRAQHTLATGSINSACRWVCQPIISLLSTIKIIMQNIYIVTCRVVRATKMTGCSSDDWIY